MEIKYLLIPNSSTIIFITESEFSITHIKSSINKDFKERPEIYQSEKLLFNTAGFCPGCIVSTTRVHNINHPMKKNTFKNK